MQIKYYNLPLMWSPFAHDCKNRSEQEQPRIHNIEFIFISISFYIFNADLPSQL